MIQSNSNFLSKSVSFPSENMYQVIYDDLMKWQGMANMWEVSKPGLARRPNVCE